jgi:EAL domain-containing protein (putative c-di-GMP-specific phosphodiesterase class I)
MTSAQDIPPWHAIETPEQLTQVQTLGCAYAQGYFFSPAVDPEMATKALQADNWTMARTAPSSTLPTL